MQGIDHKIETRYLTDPAFHALVDSMTACALDNDWSSQDMIDAMRATDVRVRQAQLRTLSTGGSER